MTSAAPDPIGDPAWSQRSNVRFKAWVQVRYHRRRQRFFDLLDKVTKSITIVMGASLLGGQLSQLVPWLGAAITSLGMLALVFGYSDRKQLHKELGELAARLVADIEALPPDRVDLAVSAAWAADYARLVARSPPVLKTLTLLCEREQAVADGHPEHIPLPAWYRRLIAGFF